jgi:hypothetical protein
MPYDLRRTKGGYKVGHKGESKTFSSKPMSRSQAVRQMRALYANTKAEQGGRS